MNLGRIGKATFVIVALASFGLAACGEDDEEPPHEEGHEPTSPFCVELSEVCHEADTGTGPAHDCHEVAHADVDADCEAQLASCTATCMP